VAIKKLEINSKELSLMKPVTAANYDKKTVLTNSSWEYVDLWLKRQSKNERAKQALFFWTQAKNFFDASEVLPIESRPLTAYYCCMNAAKALLAIKGPKTINFDNITHGVSSDRRQWGKSNNIKQAEVKFSGSGVLFELSKYLGEEACKKTYSVYDLMYNIPCIHRAFSITYGCPELFIPIRDINYIVDSTAKKGWIQFKIDDRYANGNVLRYLPKHFENVTYNTDGACRMRHKKRFKWDRYDNMSERLETLKKYHGIMRKDLLYIYGDTKLWYVKKEIPNNSHIIKRNSITLIFAVMHWLSELVRYNPEKFNKLMSTNQNWLIHEFVDNALNQFIDEISCEITGVDIMASGYRK